MIFAPAAVHYPLLSVRRGCKPGARGGLFIGADCAIEIWRRTPGDAWLVTLANLSRPASRFVYDRFADLLYAWNRNRKHW